jgi:hypothetical protein
MANCNECSDSKYSSCPAKMSDGRLFTDYRPRCFSHDVNKNSYDYRQFMIHNAQSMLNEERTKLKMCGPCVEPFNIGTMLEEQTIVKCDQNSCQVVMNNPNGLGQGRSYNIDHSAHNKFLKDREIENKMASCCDVNSESDFNMFMANDTQGRFATPGGGSF